MVAYNFQSNFGPDIIAGRKTSTLRVERVRAHAEPGQMMQLFIGMRSDNCVRLLNAPCIAQRRIDLHQTGAVVDGVFKANPDYYSHLAKIEGFNSFGDLQAWFDRVHGLPCLGLYQMEWDYSKADAVATLEGLGGHG